MSVFDSELYAASCALQYAAGRCTPQSITGLPHSRAVSLSIDSQAAMSSISRPGYSYQAPLLHDIRKATSSVLLSGSAVQIG